ncbi:MAG: response regulator transcription factor [Bacteroidales bacterium]|nr:response regulator transcription factor [Bacteroidales bacterium]
MKTPINTIIVDDNLFFLESLASLLSHNENFNIMGLFESGEHLLQYRELHYADLVLMDIEMPGLNGIEAAKRLNYLFLK